MSWNRNEDSWKQVNGNLTEEWGDLTEDQLERRIRLICENPDDLEAAEAELTDWQHRLNEINRAVGEIHRAA